MNADQRLLVVGIYISASLYLAGCFAASLFVQHGHAWKLALASMATCYCAYMVQVVLPELRATAWFFVLLSQAVGALAGAAVMLGV